MSESARSNPIIKDPSNVVITTTTGCPWRRAAFTLIELLVTISIIIVLAALTLVVTGRMKEKARSAQCVNQLRTIGMATRSYVTNNDGILPFTQHQARSRKGQSWVASLQPYADGTVSFRCPADAKKDRLYSYVINDYLTPNPVGAKDLDYSVTARISSPMSTVLFGECAETYTGSDHFHFAQAKSPEGLQTFFKSSVAIRRHSDAANYLFADGHVETLNWEEVSRRLTEPGSRFVHPDPDK